MLSNLIGFFTRGSARRRERVAGEYATMSPGERRTADELREAGPQGERALIVERQADRYVDAEEGRPPDA